MGKIKTLIITLCIFFFSITTVSAACTVEETNRLNSLAVNVKVSYEEAEGVLDEDEFTPPDGMTEEESESFVATYNFFRIYITNLTEDLYIKVYNDVTGITDTYKYENSNNGTIVIHWENISMIANFTISVYSTDNTNCPNNKLSTLYLTTPRYNDYSSYNECKGNENFYLCHKYLSVPSVSFDKFINSLAKYKNGSVNDKGEEIIKNKNDNDSIISNRALIICILTGILLVTGLTVMIIIKKQRSKKYEKGI